MKRKRTRSRIKPPAAKAQPRTRARDRTIDDPDTSGTTYTLRLFVTGNSPRSSAAVATIRAICDTYLAGKFELEVVDIYQQPAAAVAEQIIAAPTLIKQQPAPVRRMVGSLADPERVLVGLEIVPAESASQASPTRSDPP